MAAVLNIKDAEAYRLASNLAHVTGKTLTRVVIDALKHETERVQPRGIDVARLDRALALADSIPDRDSRSLKEVMDDLYDESGLPR